MNDQRTTATTTQQPLPAVRHQVTVPLAPEEAFTLFTDGFQSWWPDSHHIGAAPLEQAIIEPRAGGRWYERDADGTECDWGEVLAYQPPARLVLRWQLDAEFRYDPDPGHGSEIEVLFTSAGTARTTVQVEHGKFERHGAQAQAVRDAVGSDGGWSTLLDLYRDKAARQAAGQ